MKTHDQKRLEWNDQALGTDDPKAQVARPGDEGSFSELVRDIRAKLKINDEVTSLLDVGCGNGLVLSALAGDIELVSGIDYADAMIDMAKEQMPNADFKTGPAAPLPFNSNQYSRVLCYSIFHYFPDPQYALNVLAELVRVAKPGGVILVGDILDIEFEEEIKKHNFSRMFREF